MGKQVVLQRRIWNLILQDGKKLFHTVEIEDWQKTLREMEFCLQELLVDFVRVDLRVDGFVSVDEKLLFISHSEIKCNIISVCFDRESEELNLEFYLKLNHVLKSQSELSVHDEDHDCSLGPEELFVGLKEFGDHFMGKNNRSAREFIRSFVRNKH